MRNFSTPHLLTIALIAGFVFVVPGTRAQQVQSTISANSVKIAMERALMEAPRDYQTLQAPDQTGVRVLGVDVRQAPAGQKISVDLSQRALTYDPSGNVEPLLDRMLAGTAALTNGTGNVDYEFLVDGLPLEQFLPRSPVRSSVRSLPLGKGGAAVISAGHGWYWHEASSTWRLQRDYYRGIVEDVVNWDIANYVRDELRAANVDARLLRYPNRDANVGMSGRPRWEESAKYFIQVLGAPPEVWNIGVDDYARDINTRPMYANWIDSAAMVSIHNNGGGGTGTETWYDATNGQEYESHRLAEIVNNRIVAFLRARYDRNWPDRGLRTCNGCKGENRLAARPAIIVEGAFMDTPSPDNDALHDEAFKHIVAEAIRAGLLEWTATVTESDSPRN